MKKILFLFFVLFSPFAFSQSCEKVWYEWANLYYSPDAVLPSITSQCAAKSGRLVKSADTYAYTATFTCYINAPCSSSSSSSSLSSSKPSSSSSSSAGLCSPPLIENTVLQGGQWVTSCIENPDSNIPTSSAPSCPQGQYFDSQLGCNNSFQENALDCGQNTFATALASGGYNCSDQQPDNTNCAWNIGSGVSNYTCQTVSANSNSSSPSNTASSNSGVSAAASSASTSINSTLQNCELTFGVGNCSTVPTSTPCPNSYKISGVTYCVTTTSGGSGTGSSSGSGSGAGSGSGSGSAESAGDCDPTSVDYFKCITPDGGDMPDHTETESGFKTVADVNKNFNDRLKKSPVVSSFSAVKNIISLTSSSCPEFSLTLFGRDISTTVHCSMWALIAVVLSPLMIAFWTIIAFRIFASA